MEKQDSLACSNRLILVGRSLSEGTFAPGQAISAGLLWRARRPLPPGRTLRLWLHGEDSNGRERSAELPTSLSAGGASWVYSNTLPWSWG